MTVLVDKIHSNKWFVVQLQIATQLWYVTNGAGHKNYFILSLVRTDNEAEQLTIYTINIFGFKLGWGIRK